MAQTRPETGAEPLPVLPPRRKRLVRCGASRRRPPATPQVPVREHRLEPLALVCVRQSTPREVLGNWGPMGRQDGLRALRWGRPAERT